MTKITKLAAIAVAALTLAVGSVATSSEAHAWGKKGFGWGPAVGLGIAAGVIGSAAYAGRIPATPSAGTGRLPLGCPLRQLGQLSRLHEGLRPLLS